MKKSTHKEELALIFYSTVEKLLVKRLGCSSVSQEEDADVIKTFEMETFIILI